MSKKYLTGSKRLQIIQRWLNGVDDPNFEVFPTKKEGKYIVKPRKINLNQTTKDPNEESIEQNELKTEQNELEQEPIEEPKAKPKPMPRPKPIPEPKQTNINTHNQFFDPTMSYEILNQLKLLGEEFKAQREKKEQKRMIKEVVQKQITKPRNIYNYTEPNYTQQPNMYSQQLVESSNNETIEHQNDFNQNDFNQPMFNRRRNNIFADVM